jgi:phosphate-selective porin OprO/OprP
VRWLAAALVSGWMLGAGPAQALPPEDGTDPEDWSTFHVGWDSGLTYEYLQRIPNLFESGAPAHPEADAEVGVVPREAPEPHRRFHLKGRVGGSLYLDGGVLGGSAVDDGPSGAIRRARLYTSGEIGYWFTTEYKFEFALERFRIFLNDFYLRWRPERWVDSVKLGYFDPPMSLQALGSSSARGLMEVAAPVAAFAPGFRVGLQATGIVEDPSLSWALDLASVGQQQTIGNASSDPVRIVGRLVWRPWGPERVDAPLLHLGASASFAFSAGGSIQYRARPESFLAPYLVDTGSIDGHAALLAAEAAWRDGPVSLQGELLYSLVTPKRSGNAHVWGTYAQVGWVITGESRSYDSAGAVFGRVQPKTDFAPWRGGWGSVELTARASWVDLSNGPVEGGRMVTATVGPAWTWNRWVRVLLGYVFAHAGDGPGSGSAHIGQLRLELVL